MPETSPDKEKLPGGAEIVVRDSENGRAVSASIDDVVRIELSEILRPVFAGNSALLMLAC